MRETNVEGVMGVIVEVRMIYTNICRRIFSNTQARSQAERPARSGNAVRLSSFWVHRGDSVYSGNRKIFKTLHPRKPSDIYSSIITHRNCSVGKIGSPVSKQSRF